MDINSDEFKDRSGGLKAFGVVLIILGAFNLLMVPLAVLGSVMGRSAGAGQSAGYWAFSLAVNLLTLPVPGRDLSVDRDRFHPA